MPILIGDLIKSVRESGPLGESIGLLVSFCVLREIHINISRLEYHLLSEYMYIYLLFPLS